MSSMNLNTHVIYISKVSLTKKGGYLKNIRDASILELHVFGRVWNIYQKKYYIFNRERSTKMKHFLKVFLIMILNHLRLHRKNNCTYLFYNIFFKISIVSFGLSTQ